MGGGKGDKALKKVKAKPGQPATATTPATTATPPPKPAAKPSKGAKTTATATTASPTIPQPDPSPTRALVRSFKNQIIQSAAAERNEAKKLLALYDLLDEFQKLLGHCQTPAQSISVRPSDMLVGFCALALSEKSIGAQFVEESKKRGRTREQFAEELDKEAQASAQASAIIDEMKALAARAQVLSKRRGTLSREFSVVSDLLWVASGMHGEWSSDQESYLQLEADVGKVSLVLRKIDKQPALARAS